MEKVSAKLIIRLFLVAMLVCIIILLFLRGSWFDPAPVHALTDVDENWNITRDSDVVTGVPLSSYVAEDVRKGDIISLVNRLPQKDLSAPVLSFTTDFSAVEVLVDGEIIYRYGMEPLSGGKMLPRVVHHTALPENYASGAMTIRITAGTDDAFSRISAVCLGDADDLFRHDFARRRLPFFIGVFLCMFSLMQFVFVPYMMRSAAHGTRFLLNAFISLFMGIFILAYYNLFDYFTGRHELNMILEFVSIYLNALVVTIRLSLNLRQKRLRLIYRVLTALNAVFTVAALVLHFSGRNHLMNLLPLYYLIVTAEALPLIVLMVLQFIRSRRVGAESLIVTDLVQNLGFFIYFVCCFIDIIRNVFGRYFGRGLTADRGIPFIIFGSFIFTLVLMLNYFLNTILRSDEETAKNHLAHLAYSDPMTGLSNRARCAQVMEVLSRGTDPYTIFSLDMDHLKRVNDTLGHTEGDRLIRGFAQILQECFWDAVLIGRMGGDEFIVITGDTEDTVIKKRMQTLRTVMAEWNRRESAFEYSTSYGYAHHYETPSGWAHEVYTLADNRMYEMKRQRHQEAGE